MAHVMKFIVERFSGYTLILFFLSSWLLLFVDRRQLKRKGLNKEAWTAFIMGMACVAVALTAFLIGTFYSGR